MTAAHDLVDLASTDARVSRPASQRVLQGVKSGKLSSLLSSVCYQLVSMAAMDVGAAWLVKDHSAIIRIQRYDDDGVYRFAVGLAYVQNHEHADDNLDHKLLSNISQRIVFRGLGDVINDVCVNGQQWRFPQATR